MLHRTVTKLIVCLGLMAAGAPLVHGLPLAIVLPLTPAQPLTPVQQGVDPLDPLDPDSPAPPALEEAAPDAAESDLDQAPDEAESQDSQTELTLEPPVKPAPAAPMPPVSTDWAGNRVDYKINARLDDEEKSIRGDLTLEWTNGTDKPARDLWFHLYLNAFSNNRSSHLFESRGKLRDYKVKDGWGWSDIDSVTLVRANGPEVDLLPSFRFRQPDDGRREDHTVFSVDLPRDVAPGETISVKINWDSKLPRVRRRTGYKDDFLLMAQWFPKLGVFEGAQGWNCHQFHMNSEFFSDYGTYDVTLDLPESYEGKVLASGRDHRPVPDGDRIKLRFMAPTEADAKSADFIGRNPVIHDFTWAASKNASVHEAKFRWAEWAQEFAGEVERAAKAFGPDEPLRVRDVDVSVLIHPEHETQAERHVRATSAALFFYGLWFGGYPYEHITVVDPPWGGAAAGGMEYPTLFTAGSRMFTSESDYTPESVTVHEAGHQFWYGLVGNNEFEASWMDEGLNSYTDSEVLYRVYGPKRASTLYFKQPAPGVSDAGYPIPGQPVVNLLSTNSKLAKLATLQGVSMKVPGTKKFMLNIPGAQTDDLLALWRDQPWFSFIPRYTDPRMGDRSGYLGSPDVDRVDNYAWEYLNRTSYSVNSYSRPATILRSLPALIGYDAFLRGMRHYAKTWRYRHPYPDDFFETFQEGAGVDIDWYFRETLRGTGTVDWSVKVSQRRESKVAGFVRSDEGEWVDSAVIEEEEDGPDLWRGTVTLQRTGSLRLPVKVRVAYEDGSVEDFAWSREDQAGAQHVEFPVSHKVVSAVVDPRDPDDPEAGYWLDTNLSNNEWYEKHDRVTPLRWGERVLASFQHGLTWFVGLGG